MTRLYEYKDKRGDTLRIDSIDEHGAQVFIANPAHGYAKMVEISRDECRRAARSLDPDTYLEIARLRAAAAEVGPGEGPVAHRDVKPANPGRPTYYVGDGERFGPVEPPHMVVRLDDDRVSLSTPDFAATKGRAQDDSRDEEARDRAPTHGPMGQENEHARRDQHGQGDDDGERVADAQGRPGQDDVRGQGDVPGGRDAHLDEVDEGGGGAGRMRPVLDHGAQQARGGGGGVFRARRDGGGHAQGLRLSDAGGSLVEPPAAPLGAGPEAACEHCHNANAVVAVHRPGAEPLRVCGTCEAAILRAPRAVPEGAEAAWVADIAAERRAQDAQWGGPEHDDQHAGADWLRYIRKQVDRAESARTLSEGRSRFVKIAALAVAAIEHHDRFAAAFGIVAAPSAPQGGPGRVRLGMRRIPVSNRLVCDCGHDRFLIDTAGEGTPSAVTNLVECAACHAAYVMTVEVDDDDRGVQGGEPQRDPREAVLEGRGDPPARPGTDAQSSAEPSQGEGGGDAGGDRQAVGGVASSPPHGAPTYEAGRDECTAAVVDLPPPGFVNEGSPLWTYVRDEVVPALQRGAHHGRMRPPHGERPEPDEDACPTDCALPPGHDGPVHATAAYLAKHGSSAPAYVPKVGDRVVVEALDTNAHPNGADDAASRWVGKVGEVAAVSVGNALLPPLVRMDAGHSVYASKVRPTSDEPGEPHQHRWVRPTADSPGPGSVCADCKAPWLPSESGEVKP